MSKFSNYNFCRPSFLYNNLQSYKDKVLVFDTRDTYIYVAQAISKSINISYDHIQELIDSKKTTAEKFDDITLEDVTKLIEKEDLNRFAQRKRNYCVLILSEASFPQDFIQSVIKACGADDFFDFLSVPQQYIAGELKKAIEQMEEKQAISTGLKLFDLLQKDKVRELFILLDGSEQFFKTYPFMHPGFHSRPYSFIRSLSLQSTKLDVTYNFPNDIYENRLFLGTFNQASQEIIVKSLNITHIVNVTAECEDVYEEKGIKYLHIFVLDESEVGVKAFFQEAFDFIQTALDNDKRNKVLVHCAMGKSRSATIAIMFIMKKYNWNFEKALEYVKFRRRIVDPNYGFLKQLEEFEQSKCGFG